MSAMTSPFHNPLPVVDPGVRRPMLATPVPVAVPVAATAMASPTGMSPTASSSAFLPVPSVTLSPTALSAAAQKGQAPHRPPSPVDLPTLQELAKESAESQSERRKFHAGSLMPWSIFAGLGLWGWGLPGTVLPITEAVATQFIWSFNGQDLVGMGAPRVSKSLTRGARPYEPETDPEAQKLNGLAKHLHIARKKLAHANWPNLREELMRELASAPLMLMITTVGFGSLKPLSRVAGDTPLTLATRRAIELPYGDVRQFGKNLSTFYQQNADTLGDKSYREVSKAFFAQMFADEKDAHGQSLLDKPVTLRHDLSARLVDPEYQLTDRMLQHLANDNVDGLRDELSGFKPRHLLGGRNQPKPPVAPRTTTLRELIGHWSTAMADHVELELDGTKKSLFNSTARERNLKAQARLNYYTRLMDDAVHVLNRARPATHGDRLDQWGIAGANGIQDKAIGGRTGMLRSLDKFRDFVATVGRRTAAEKQASGSLTPETFSKAVSRLSDRVVSEKLGLTLVFTGATCAYMWWLAHAIQKGREYPANSQVSLSRYSVGNVATASSPGGGAVAKSVPSDAIAGTSTPSPALKPVSPFLTPLPESDAMTARERIDLNQANPFVAARPLLSTEGLR